MARITPNNKAETMAAWGLGIIGGIYGVCEVYGPHLGHEAIKVLTKGTHAMKVVHARQSGEIVVSQEVFLGESGTQINAVL